MSDIDLVTEYIREDNFGDIPWIITWADSLYTRITRTNLLLLLVPIQVALCDIQMNTNIEGLTPNWCAIPLNRFLILAISLLILFSSSSLTLAPRMSAINCMIVRWNSSQKWMKTDLREAAHIGRHLDQQKGERQLISWDFCVQIELPHAGNSCGM